MGKDVTIHIDATGNIVKQPAMNHKRAFYYAGVVALKTNANDKHCSVFPVTELVSTSHTTDDVGLWLRKFRHFVTHELKQWPVFTRVVTDESWVQLHAICQDWNLMTFPNYITLTHKWINNIATDTDRSSVVIISLCSAHKIKNMVKDVEKFLPSSSSKLIIEVLVSIININSYETIKTIWAMLSVVLKTKKLTQEVKNAVKIISDCIFPNIQTEITESLETLDPDTDERCLKYKIETDRKMVRIN